MTATTSNPQLKKLQIIQNKALRFIYNTRYQDYTTNETLHQRAKLVTVKERLIELRSKAMDRLNSLINHENDRNVIYKFSDYNIEIEPIFEPTNKLRDTYMRLGLLDDNNKFI